jgi:isopentenyl phosphate kinase
VLHKFPVEKAAFIKIGGSLITDKRGGALTVRERMISDIGADLVDIIEERRVVLANGAGSFGHPVVKSYGIDKDGMNPGGISRVCSSVDHLNRIVVRSLVEMGIPAVSFPPRSFVYRDAGGNFVLFREPIVNMLKIGVVPVAYGDLIFDERKGSSVISGDDIPLLISDLIDTAVFLIDMPGIIDERGEVVRKMNERQIDMVKGDYEADVTGGILSKVKKGFILRKMGIRVIISGFSKKGDIKSALKGELGTELIP